jgi:flagellar biosynthetic protein FliR
MTLDAAWLTTVLLLSIRVAAATMVTSVFGPAQIPAPVRVLIALVLGTLLASVPGALSVVPQTPVGLAAAGAIEVAIGAAFALGFLVAYATTQIAGRVLDVQMGFGIAGMIDPNTQTMASLIGTGFGMVAVAVFLGMNGHHELIRALALSVERLPPAAGIAGLDWSAGPRAAAMMFSYGLALAAPVMCGLLLADIALAVFARSMPQLNIFVMGFALKIVLGLVGLAATITLSRGVFAAIFGATFREWNRRAVGG